MVLFLDTNIWLHFRQLADWDTSKLEKPIHVRVPRITVKELNKHKDGHKSTKIRKRALECLQLIESTDRVNGFTLKNGIIVFRHPDQPAAGWAKTLGLDEKSNDDLMLAVIHEFQSANKDASITFYSDDTNARMTADDLGIKVAECPPDYKENGKSDEEIEIEKLKHQLASQKVVTPKLGLFFGDSQSKKNHCDFNFSRDIKLNQGSRTRLLEQKLDGIKSPVNPADDFRSAGEVTPDEIAKMRKYKRHILLRQEYVEYYRKYLEFADQYAIENAMTMKLDLALFNAGTAPAEDIDVTLKINFPWARISYEAPDEPREPDFPRENRTEMEQAADKDMATRRDSREFEQSENGVFTLRENIGRIKHHLNACLRPIYVSFSSFDQAESFSLDYELHCGNMTEIVKGTLHVKVNVAPRKSE